MSLHDSEGLVQEAATAAESLPDPTTVNARTYVLSNTGTVTQVWSSVGATPFLVNGVLSATISIPRGQSLRIQSDGVHWVGKTSGQPQSFAGSGVTNASGDVTFTFPAAFAVAPDVAVGIEVGGANFYFHKITARSTTAVTVHIDVAATVTVATVVVLAAATAASGVTVNVLAATPGATP